ncbi:hypothetical protein OAS39_07250 [Pirellulales bacterium]|nr:hypothetical protein [Pirellulales bacterium]
MIAKRNHGLSPQRVVCTVVRVPEIATSATNRLAGRPSELLPWADPYIANLVRQLQSEIRRERPTNVASEARRGPVNDLEPPAPGCDRHPSQAADWDDRSEPLWPAEDRFSETDE